MSTTAMQALIRQASTELGSLACDDGRHLWVSDGGRACPHDIDDNCSQAVYHCGVCGSQDYGDAGGPGDADCERHCKNRIERATAIIANSRIDPLSYEWHLSHGGLKRKLRHQTLLRHIRRQRKPNLP